MDLLITIHSIFGIDNVGYFFSIQIDSKSEINMWFHNFVTFVQSTGYFMNSKKLNKFHISSDNSYKLSGKQQKREWIVTKKLILTHHVQNKT